MVHIYQRQSQQYIEEQEVGGKSLRFLYETIPGRLLLRALVGPQFSNWKARQNKQPKSAKKIEPFAKKYNIDLSQAEQKEFANFHEFFTRKLRPVARPIDREPNHVIAVADGKLFAYPITESGEFQIKSSRYTLRELVQDEETAKLFEGGTCLVYRLAMDDYHRYVYPDAGKKVKEQAIRGVLHTVRPLAHQYTKVFAENTRQWQLLLTETFGPVLYMEVGAMLVGKMHDHGLASFKRGEEKGYFEYGASSMVVCYQKGSIQLDADILRENEKQIEVQVQLGEKVGEKDAP